MDKRRGKTYEVDALRATSSCLTLSLSLSFSLNLPPSRSRGEMSSWTRDTRSARTAHLVSEERRRRRPGRHARSTPFGARGGGTGGTIITRSPRRDPCAGRASRQLRETRTTDAQGERERVEERRLHARMARSRGDATSPSLARVLFPPPSSAPLTNLGANRAPCLRTAATPRHTSRISSFTKTLGHPVISDDARVVVRGETGHRSREAEPVSNHQRTVSGERPTIARTPGTGASSILVLKRPSARRGPGIVSVDRNVRSKCRCSCVLQFTS